MRWMRMLLTPLLLVVAGSPAHAADDTSNDDMAEACAIGYEFLSDGEVDEAKQVFRLELSDPACARGLTLADAQEVEAKAESTTCTEQAGEVAEESDEDTKQKLTAEALEHCNTAVELDTSLAEDLNETIAKLSEAPDDDEESFTLSAWWPDFWERTQSIGTVVARVLMVGLLALPLLNALGVMVGRIGSVRSRRWWRTKPLARAIATAAAIGGLVLLVGADPPWIHGELALGWRIGIGGFVVVLLAWVLAQRGHVSFDKFADEKGAREPGSLMGQLIATELNGLLEQAGGGIDVIDPLAGATFDDASVSALSGPENKVVAALLTFFRTVFQPGPAYLVTGEAIEAGSSGAGVALRLKHGRRTIDSTVIYERTLTNAPPKPADKKDDGKEDGKAESSPIDLARPAAIWVELALLREFHGDLESVPGLHGARSWRGIALRSLAAQQNRRGDVTAALASYARALDLDSDDALTCLGFATLRTRAAETDATSQLYASAIQHLTDVAGEIDADESADPLVRLVAVHTSIVARLNLVAAAADDDGTASSSDGSVLTGITASLASFDELITNAEGLKQAKADVERLRELRTAYDSMAPYRGAGITPGDEVRFARSSAKTIRGAYNAASFFATPLVRPRISGIDLPRSLDLLAIATTHPKFRSYAATDPFLAPLRKDPKYRDDFEKLVPPPATPPPTTPGLASITIIGKHFATKLEKHGVTSLEGLSLQTLADISMWTQAPIALIKEWRGLAALATIPKLDIRHLNLLHLCGVRSVTDLAAADAGDLHARLESVGSATESEPIPSMDTVAAWIAAASA